MRPKSRTLLIKKGVLINGTRLLMSGNAHFSFSHASLLLIELRYSIRYGAALTGCMLHSAR